MMKNYIVITIVALLILSITTHANAEGLLRKNGRKEKQKQLPLEKEHGVSHEVTKHENHEQLASDLNAKERKLHVKIPHRREVTVKKRIPHVVVPSEPEKCMKIHEPAICVGTSKFYYGTVESKHSLAEVNEGITKIFELLPIVSAMLKPKDQAQFTKCIPMLTNLVCHTILPRCNAKCEPMKPCKESCTDIFNGCVPKDAIKDIAKVRKGGMYRPLILSTLMASEGHPVINVVDQIVDLLSTPDCSQSFYEDNEKTKKQCLSNSYSGGTCRGPKPIVINQRVAQKTHDNMDILRNVVAESDVHSNTVKVEKDVNKTMRLGENKEMKEGNGTSDESVDEDYIPPLPQNVTETDIDEKSILNEVANATVPKAKANATAALKSIAAKNVTGSKKKMLMVLGAEMRV